MQKPVSIAALTLCLIIIPFLIHAQVYKWIDGKGTVYFSDDYSKIPEKYLPVAETQWFPKENSPRFPKEISPQSPQEIAPPKIEEKPTPIPIPQSSELLAKKMGRLFSGVISKVDGGARTIFVTSNAEGMVFPVSKDTKIKTDYGVDVPFDKLRTSMSVMIEYMENRDDIQTLSVRVSTMRRGFGQIQRDRQKEKQNVVVTGSKKTSKK
jgi:hypothetical protein